MTITVSGTETGAGTRPTFDSLNPITGDVVATHPVHSAEDVAVAVLPAGEHAVGGEGRRLTQTPPIIDYLDALHPEPKLVPPDADDAPGLWNVHAPG